MRLPSIEGALKARSRVSKVVLKTPLRIQNRWSKKLAAEIYLKREDLQHVRSFKIRGAYNKIVALSEAERSQGIVCASAGNHAQGFAFSCRDLQIKGTVFMPLPTPSQKVEQVRMFGGDFVDIRLGRHL